MDYAAKARRAAESFRRAGGPCELLRTTRAPYDASTSSADVASTKRYAGVAIADRYSIRDRDTGLIAEKDVKLYVGAVNTEGVAMPRPQPGDQITFAGVTYQVVRCDPLSPAGTDVLYEVQGRVA